ncbi:AMP-binding protein [Shouchella clausii]|uniref:AMP-binding protein n=1 Tax=Shouchella clausii TaxID=79880 RepID=UPI0021491A0F|nr:AMP-binding protein [Shouchella clausii]MCR1287491.1 AMP-binding protein [Shouchella clausii]
MLAVNDSTYTKDDLKQYERQFAKHSIWKTAEKWRIAVCPQEIEKWIALLLYVKKRGGSLVPIHPSTPLAAAKKIAVQARCAYLFFHTFETPLTLSNPVNPFPPGLVQFSSGTTGVPKQLERSWSSIDEELGAYAERMARVDVNTVVVACPVTHSYGLISGVLAGLSQDKDVVVLTAQNPKYILKKLTDYPNHLLYGAPPLLYALAKLSNGKTLQSVMTSGTRLPEEWFHLIQSNSQMLLQQYGCSEAGCISIAMPLRFSEELGVPLRHVQAKAGTARDNPSEIQVTIGSRTINTGDLGYIDQDGTLCFRERLDDMINVAGLNVYPHEVEHVLREHPSVEDAVVYKKADSYAGERVCAQVSARTETPSLHELRSFCISRLAPHQVPHEITIVEEIAKNANGKISRVKLGEAKG